MRVLLKLRGKQSDHLWFGGWAAVGIYDRGCGWENEDRESGDCALRLGERAPVSRRVTREPCERDETGRLGGSARGQRARPVAYPLKPVTLDGW